MTGPLSLETILWPTVGVGLHLLPLDFAGDGRAGQFSSHDAAIRDRAPLSSRHMRFVACRA